MTYTLTPDEMRSFEQNGYVGPFDLYDRTMIERELPQLRASLLNRQHAPYLLRAGGNIANYDRHLDVPFLAQHVRRRQLVDRIRRILGEDLLCWRTEFFVKYPGGEGTDWHQSRNLALGSGVTPLHATRPHPRFPDVFLTLSVWTALTDSTRENGCLQVVPGSHHELRYDDLRPVQWRSDRECAQNHTAARGFFGYDTRDFQIEADWTPPESRAIDLELTPGQCVILWEATMHASRPNRTLDKTRMAFVCRYVPTDVYIYPNMTTLEEYGGSANLENWRAILVCGTDRYHFNRLLEEEASP